METTNHHLEMISKLRQRLLRLIKLGEPINQLRSTTQTNNDNNNNNTRPSIDLTANVEECVRCLFNSLCSVEIFIQDVQQILNVTIKSSLSLFLAETIPLAHQYLQQHQYDPLSWDTFKTIALPTTLSNINSNTSNQTTNITRLPSLQQACFRLPPSCPQLIDLTSSLSTRSIQEQTFITPSIRADANPYEHKLINRFARYNFYLNEYGEQLFLQTLYTFLKYIIRRLLFFTQHRIDTRLLDSNRYEMTSNVREQMRFLFELNKVQNGESNNNLNSGIFQRKSESINIVDEEQKRTRIRDYRLSIIEQLRQKEADETACLVLRESRLKRQKISDNNRNIMPTRILRASLQELIAVMESEPILKRSKTLLYAYANR
ncbi:unnamed protein product [Rotaria sp. Silwood2]|nr:unnamed protein product [Rotaria sp. Silwood2]CAF2751501.1 unnamed protein product [Rotaria sp. Silwood2]CAF2910468.1 unnamed protein product [Rotaria sp. Silwood2]CAF3876208.1 unnamed protein product [Rotaria sp. Silwood2]CAF4468055.1 unnamed protein product [Rotaria sp. Silwood2]